MLYCLFTKESQTNVVFIREYGSTLYVGMALKKNGRPYILIASVYQVTNTV